jgi:DNA-binding transcriptional MerR regulator
MGWIRQTKGGRALTVEELVSTREKAARLAGIRTAKVDYWVQTGIIQPSSDQRLSPRSRVVLFDYRELLSLMVAAQLRERRISLQHIRVVVQRLRERGYGHPLAELVFATEGRKVYFQDEHGEWEAGHRPGQALIPHRLDLGMLRARIEASTARPAEAAGQSERRRGVLGSKPVFEGTRVPVATIVRYLQAGKTQADILKAYPALTAEDIATARLSA